MADTSLLPGLDVAWMSLGSLGAAVAVVGGAWAVRVRAGDPAGWRRRVTAGDAWTAGDSWLTNITVVTGVLSSLWSRLAFSGGNLPPGSSDATVFVLFVMFTAAAALAPVVYAACAADDAGVTVTGTVFGYLLAAVAVLLGAFGMTASLAVYVWGALAQTPAARAVVLPFLALGAALTAVYALRTLTSVLRNHTSPPPSRPAPGEPAPAGPATAGPATASFLVGTQRARRSATL